MSRRGKLVLVVAPSGSGKDTLIEAAQEAIPTLRTLVTCTTRAPRPGEVQDVDYHFLSPEDFDTYIADDAFLEWAPYGGQRYGTLKASIEDVLAAGDMLVANIEVQGARCVLELLPPEGVVIIYIEAGGWEVLEKRISARAPITAEELEKRHARYRDEASFKEQATYVVENFDGALETAKAVFVALIQKILTEAQV